MRISATTLESFRLFKQPDQEWMTQADLIASIRGTFTPTRPVEIGLAFGRIVEDPDRYAVPGGFVCNGFSFGADTMAPAFALIDRRGVFEAKAEKTYHDGIVVVSKADHLFGERLSEFKTTASTFDFDKYAASCQWRFMVDAFEPSMVTYRVFRLDDHDNGVVEVKDIDSFNLYPYPELHADCVALIREFVTFVTSVGLDGMLRERQQKAEAGWAA